MAPMSTKCPQCSGTNVCYEPDGFHIDGHCPDCGHIILEEEQEQRERQELQDEIDFWKEETHYWKDEVEFLCGEVFDLHQENLKLLKMLDCISSDVLSRHRGYSAAHKQSSKIREYLNKINYTRPSIAKDYMDKYTDKPEFVKEREEN